jgi:hypothetical protein
LAQRVLPNKGRWSSEVRIERSFSVLGPPQRMEHAANRERIQEKWRIARVKGAFERLSAK